MSTSATHQRGAALTEFIVIALFVLVPLYLAVQALGKFADVRHTANNAARYAAWEKTVWHEEAMSDFANFNAPNQKSAAAIHNEMMVRVFNDRKAGLKYASTDKAATTFANGTDPLWRDTAGAALFSNPARLGLWARYVKPSNDVPGAAIGLINAIPIPHVIAGTLAPPVPTQTMAVVGVNLDKVGGDSEVYKRLWAKSAGLPTHWDGLDYVASGAILSNTWASNASGGTKKMVAKSVPTANLLGKAVSSATDEVMRRWDPSLVIPERRLEMGKIAPDVVPGDRLK